MATADALAFPSVRLGDVVTLRAVRAEPKSLDPTLPYVGLDHVEPHSGKILSFTNPKLLKSGVCLFEGGDVLYGRLRPYLSKVAAVEFSGAASSEFLVLQPGERITSRYLQQVLLSQGFISYAQRNSKGDRPRVSYASVAAFSFQLPPISEQVRLCTQLDVLTAATAQLSATLRMVTSDAMRLVDATRERLLHSDEDGRPFPLGTLGELCKRIQYGTSKKCRPTPVATPVLRIPNVVSGVITHRDMKYARFNQKEIESLSVRPGDILVVRSNGSIDLVGTAALVTEREEGALFAGYLIRLSPSEGVRSEFLIQALRSRDVRKQISSAARSTAGINNLNSQQLASLRLRVPSPSDQVLVAGKLEAIQNAAHNFTNSVNSLLKNISRCMIAASAALLSIPSHLDASEPAREALVPREQKKAAPKYLRIEMEETLEGDVRSQIEKMLDQSPSKGIVFADLRENVMSDYDELRDAVFSLLSGEQPKVIQRYDRRQGMLIDRKKT